MKKTIYYGKAQVIVGDETSHGGIVLTESPTHSWHNIPIARKGDTVYCPRCPPHIFSISEGLPNGTDPGGRQMAMEGHKTTCGATLIARSAPSDIQAMAQAFFNQKGFDDKYVLRDSAGHPMPNTYYAVQRASGNLEYGTTDQQGRTHLYLSGDQQEEISFYIAG